MKDQNKLFEDLSKAFSSSRLSSYLLRPECQTASNAISAYSWNIQLSQALYPTLQTLEITLRNALYHAIAEDYQTAFWFDLPFLQKQEQDAVKQAKIMLTKQRKLFNADHIIAELRFGFWTSLFDIRYEHQQRLWPRLLRPIFPYLPRKLKTRHYLSKQFNRIRQLRNRISHYEPIWYWHDLDIQHQTLLDLIYSISPAASTYIQPLDHFKIIHKKGLIYY